MMRVKLADVCERGSSNLKQADIPGKSGDYPVYGASGYIGNVDFYQQKKPYVAVVKDGAGIGRAMLLPAESSVIGTMQYLLPKSVVLPEYLFYVVKHMHLEKYFSGATIPHIYFKDYQNEEFTLDDLNKQHEVVTTLRKVEFVIENRQQQLQKLDELVKARFVEMFGDPIMNPKRYPVHQLSEYISSLTSGSRGWAQYCVENGTEWFITIKNVKDCHITTDNMQPVNAPDNAEAKRTKVQEGDLLISITADLGRTGVVTKEIAEHGAYINQHLSCIRVNKEVLHPLFVAHYMESPAGKEQFTAKNQSAVKAGLNFNSINSLKLYVPPLKEQEEFITFITQVTKSKF
ncbi:restriction endonuclease subunit S [Gallintestinimicrobium propionicum]|uniref:restriction endonuclease subunit S n=1 Tax=Gallintestinimicrobium propionicum TaxID=2981770 RepID=UPI0032C082DC